MQTVRIGQAVILIMIVAIAASCAASKEYTGKLFAPRTPLAQDSQAVAIRFLELDSLERKEEGWVTTDIIMGRDTVSKTLALDKLAKIFPANPVAVNSPKMQEEKTTLIITETKTIPAESEPVAKTTNPGEIRNKRSRE